MGGSVYINSGALVGVMKKWERSLYEGGSGDVYAVYLEDPNTKPVIRSFIDHLLTSLTSKSLALIIRPTCTFKSAG